MNYRRFKSLVKFLDEFSVLFLRQFCSNQASTRFVKRGRHQVGGPISIDFINQMLESRKVQSYPYPAEMDPYLV